MNSIKWPAINIQFNNLQYQVTDLKNDLSKKILLRNVSGEFRSNELTAIMGPSGCGKTTLLNVLAGYRIEKYSGEILVNANNENRKLLQQISRYIMQDEVLDQLTTVRESMLVAAHLKLDSDLSLKDKNDVIDEILDNLRLKKSENTLNSKLSGGEKKRLSIAMELLNNPPVIFLDEPTTGLDDLSCSQCIALLKRIAKGGRTIICSIHTPSAKLFSVFDNVYILAEGQCVYQGPTGNIVPFVKSVGLECPLTYNPADFIIEVSCGEYGTEYPERMVVAVENGKCFKWDPCPEIRIYQSNKKTVGLQQSCNGFDLNMLNVKSKLQWPTVIRVLFWRMLIRMWRDKTVMKLKWALLMIFTLAVGGLFQSIGNDASKALYNYGFVLAILLFCCYFSMMPVLAAFPAELKLMRREYFNKWYSIESYYCAMILAKIPILIFFGSIFFISTYLMAAQPLEIERFLKLYSVSVMTALISDCFGVVIAAKCGLVNGQFIGPAINTPLMLYATFGFGYGIKDASLFQRVAMNLSFLRHGMLGIMAALYGNSRPDTICPDDEVVCIFKNSKFLMRTFGTDDPDYFVAISVLFGFLIVFNVWGCFLIKKRLSTPRNDLMSNFEFIQNYFKLHKNRS